MIAMVWLVTGGHDLLPTLLSGGRYTPVMIGVVSAVWLLCLARCSCCGYGGHIR